MSSQLAAADMRCQERRSTAGCGRRARLELRGADGILLHGSSYGWGRHGRPLLLVHGLASNAQMWNGTTQALAALDHPTVALDLRGHGQSEKPSLGYDFGTLVEDLACVLAELIVRDGPRWRHPVLVGQSLGGNLALEFAASHPDRLAGVACVDGGFINLQNTFPSWDECADGLAPPELRGVTLRDLEAMLRRDAPDWPQEGIEGMLACFDEGADGFVRPHLQRDRHMSLLHELWEHPPSRLYAAVRLPVLILPAGAGGAPAFTKDRHADVQLALTQLPWGRARWFERAGHDIHAQFPTEVAQVIHDAIAAGFLA